MSEPPPEKPLVTSIPEGLPKPGGGESASGAGSGVGTTTESMDNGKPPTATSGTAPGLSSIALVTEKTDDTLPDESKEQGSGSGAGSTKESLDEGALVSEKADHTSSAESDEEQDDELAELPSPMKMKNLEELTKSSSPQNTASPTKTEAVDNNHSNQYRRMSVVSQGMAQQAEAMAAALAAAGDEAATVKPVKKNIVLWVVSLNAILVTAANTIYLPGFKQVQDDFDTTAAMVALTVTSYTIGQGVQPLISGPLADAIGRRGPMLVAHVTFLSASVACALAPTIGFLIAARVFQALGGCTFLIVGQAQVGDVFPRLELSEALAFFSLSRMFAAMVGPLAGGILCELFGWRSTFWFCAIIDCVLLLLSFVYVPETLKIPKEMRQKLSWTTPFRPLREMKYKEVGLMCLLSGANHGVLYVTMLTSPQIMTLLTQNEMIVGLFMVPLVLGTLIGSKLAGKIARPKSTALTPEQTAELPVWDKKSFLRMWFPWSVCGNRCHSLEPDPDPDGSPVLPSQLPPRCLGFLTTPIGEWNAILVGILMNIGMSSLFGWVTVSFCDDGKLIPVPTAPTDNVTGGTSNLVAQHKYNPFSIDDLMYRIDAGVECEWWNWVAILLQWVAGFCMCLGAMMVVVGSATYLAVNRPEARSSVAASQRSTQMMFAAIELAIGGFLFEEIGPGLMHSTIAAASSIFILLICCIDKDPTPSSKTTEEAVPPVQRP